MPDSKTVVKSGSEKSISPAVIKRLPRYYRYLGDLLKNNVVRISSKELSQRMNVTASQIRQDLNNFGGFGQVFVLGDDVLKQLFADFEVVPPLLEGDAEDLLRLLLGRNVVWVDGHHVVTALALGFQNGQGFVGVAGGDDPVGNLSFDQKSGIFIAGIGKGDEISEGRHTVCSSCSCISTC